MPVSRKVTTPISSAASAATATPIHMPSSGGTPCAASSMVVYAPSPK